MFPQEYINFGKIVNSGSCVSVYKSLYDCKYLPNLPGGRVVNAYWQGTHIVVQMDSGKSYVYEDFGNWSYFW